MRFAIYSPDSSFLSWWARLQDEGHDVLVYRKENDHRKIGEGIVPFQNNLAAWEAWARAKPAQTLALFDGSRSGKYADSLRRAGLRVVGGGALCDRMEEDRRWSARMARLLGIAIPPHREFSSVAAAIAWLKGRPADEEWYFKSNRYLGASMTSGGPRSRLVPFLEDVHDGAGDRIAFILQKKIEGAAISTAGWWNGRAFVPPFEGTIEHKALMNDDVGPSTGCSFNVLWFYGDDPAIVRDLHFAELAEYLRREEAPPGIYDINAVVPKDGSAPRFLEFTPRLGGDSEPTSQALLDPAHAQGDLSAFLVGLADGTLSELPMVRDEAALSLRLTIPPYPREEPGMRHKIDPVALGVDGLWEGPFVAYGLAKDGKKYRIVDPFGIVGLALARGRDLGAMNAEAVDYASAGLWVKDLQYRTDADRVLGKDIHALRKVYPQTAAMLTIGGNDG